MSYIIFFPNGDHARYNDDDQLHCENKPAVSFGPGSGLREAISNQKEWYLNGKRHRIDGPAIYGNCFGEISWWCWGKKIDCSSQEEFLRFFKLKAFW
jgi:hypothetical protein